jgi:hypothetical protein
VVSSFETHRFTMLLRMGLNPAWWGAQQRRASRRISPQVRDHEPTQLENALECSSLLAVGSDERASSFNAASTSNRHAFLDIAEFADHAAHS